MVNIQPYELDIQEPIKIDNEWYAHAGFGIVEKSKILGILPKDTVYNETFFLLITSSGLKTKPAIEDITEKEFSKRLVQKEYDKGSAMEYINDKIREASKQQNSENAFEYLENIFSKAE